MHKIAYTGVLLGLVLAGDAGAQAVNPETAAVSEPEVRVQLAPINTTTLSAELAAVIQKLTVRDGERFKHGELLVEFDCSIQKAQLDKAQATADGAKKTYDVNSRLAQLESISSLEVDVAEAKLGEAKADIALYKASLKKCRISAPFSGRVAQLHAHQYQHLKVGDPIMDILDDGQLEIRMIVPSPWLSWLKAGQKFQIHIDELNQEYPAEVSTLGARIDPVSQTVAVIGKIKGKHPELLAGMSGQAKFPEKAN
ncbi:MULTISPECIES: efflux RND transporter periplasmic adaptor subunit [Methylomonas]|uniref:efflux RND transporter periplasmic adaptor subunit n=1 Tax=Methylomonas TaxID=416 RepID=UPI0012327483|nr:efflux RND transporter periplasmic adaptor subunit [Methylomonas rhizoryzae]